MSLWHIAWSYLWNRRLTTSLTVVSVALGAALIYSVLTLYDETDKRFKEEAQAYDTVVGGKEGSPLQLVLSAVYFMDKPPGNIAYSDYEWIRNHEDVAEAYPINLGDTYKGFRIAGTLPEFFDQTWVVSEKKGITRHPFQVAKGRRFERSMEAVLGSVVAGQTGLEIGDSFAGTHGFVEGYGEVHKEFPYTVVGILAPSSSPMDRAIFCNLESTYIVHSHHAHHDEESDSSEKEYGNTHDDHPHVESEHAGHPEPLGHDSAESEAHAENGPATGEEKQQPIEVTAVLVRLKSPGDRWVFKDEVNDTRNAMAAIPADQITNLYAQFLAKMQMVLLAVGFLVVVISGLSIMIGLYLSIIQRKRDLAVMRALGASAYEILGSVLIEAFWVTLLGIGAGYVLGSVASWGAGVMLARKYGLTISVVGVNRQELAAFCAIALVGILAGIVPAWQAYKTDVARDLAEL